MLEMFDIIGDAVRNDPQDATLLALGGFLALAALGVLLARRRAKRRLEARRRSEDKLRSRDA